MERIHLHDSHTALYFCAYWCADRWITDNQDTYPGAQSVEYDLRPRECVYCAGCGTRIATGSDCPLCDEGLPCPASDWLMTATAAQFAQALARRGRTLTRERQAAAEFLTLVESSFSGEELAAIILGGPPGLGPGESDLAGGAPEAADCARWHPDRSRWDLY